MNKVISSHMDLLKAEQAVLIQHTLQIHLHAHPSASWKFGSHWHIKLVSKNCV